MRTQKEFNVGANTSRRHAQCRSDVYNDDPELRKVNYVQGIFSKTSVRHLRGHV